MTENDGGPAFPRPYVAVAVAAQDKPVRMDVPHPEDWPDGMTLRDYFAAHAPEWWVREYVCDNRVKGAVKDVFRPGEYYELIVRAQYAYADAMLKERADGR